MQPLFKAQPIIGTGFADILAGGDMAQAYKAALEQVLVQGQRLLPQIASFELAGRNGVRHASELIETHRFDYQVGDQIMRVPGVWLSQGYQATIAWVADLVGQMLWEAGTAMAPEDMEGLVLIDELDLHLHPSWQRVLVPALRASFPRVQFIATTHSPLLLTGLRDDEIVRLSSDEDGNIRALRGDDNPALMTGSELYDHYFGITRPRYAADFQRYSYLAGKPERSDDEDREVRELLARLQQVGIEPNE
jgi:hypothetical protein